MKVNIVLDFDAKDKDAVHAILKREHTAGLWDHDDGIFLSNNIFCYSTTEVVFMQDHNLSVDEFVALESTVDKAIREAFKRS